MIGLTEDLMIEILERLPTKSLMRFKAVDRSWNALFKTNTFVSRHRNRLQKQNQNNEPHQQRFIVNCDDISLHLTMLSCNHIHNHNPSPPPTSSTPPFDVQYLKYPSPVPNNYHLDWLNLLGYFNGVVCLEGIISSDYVHGPSIIETILWNPATRETKLVTTNPNYPFYNGNHGSSDIYGSFGFGASDHNTFDDFKLIKFYYTFPDHNNKDIITVFAELYSVNTNSCTVIHDTGADDFITFDNRPYHYGLVANGVCHWLVDACTHILCFDFACNNKFFKVNTPSAQKGSSILLSRDSIAYVSTGHRDFSPYYLIEVWILDRDDFSWTKLWNIETFYAFINVYALWKDDTEFFGSSKYHSCLALYDSRARLKRPFQFANYVIDVHMHEYVESIATFSL